MEPLAETMARIVARAKAGPPDDTPPAPARCGTCRGAERLRYDVPVGDPQFGRSGPCPDCAGEVANRRLVKLWGELPVKFRDWTLESLDAHAIRLRDGETRGLIAELVREWLPTEWWLYLWGHPGRGKTGLAIGLLVECIRSGKSGLFKIVPDMLDTIRTSYRTQESMADDSKARALMASLYSVDVLVLDDIGTEKATDWVSQILFQIIGTRHANELRTILTSNDDLTDLAEHLGHSRTSSRILEMTDDGRWQIEVRGQYLRSSR